MLNGILQAAGGLGQSGTGRREQWGQRRQSVSVLHAAVDRLSKFVAIEASRSG